jgi:integrase
MLAVAKGKTAKRQKTKARGLAVVRGGRGTATRSVGTLGAILTYAVEQGMRADNPAHRVRKYAEGRRERRLSDDEYAMLGTALRVSAEQKIWPPALAAAEFMALTGWRSGEALALRWEEVDLIGRTARLGDTKTGASMRPLSHAACAVLARCDRSGALVFAPSKGKTHMTGFRKYWLKIAANGGLPSDITPHILRHSFASLASGLEYSELTIAALIGHKGRSMTSRYVHTADALLLKAADAVAGKTAALMGVVKVSGSVTELFPQAAG